jgi:membrane protease subunit HflC
MKTNEIKWLALVIVVIALLITLVSASYVVPEGRQAVITQFGKPVRSVQEAGLHFKLPFVQDVRKIDLRILSWDGYPNQIPTKDKKYIEVDTTARWKIVDPLKFIQTVQSERGARSRLDAILDGITRDVISSQNLVEAVRNSNTIIEVVEQKKEEAQAAKEESDGKEKIVAAAEEEITGEVEPIQIGREELSQMIVDSARSELKPLGVELIDVQLKRISYQESVQEKVYSRMISERQRIAEKIRSFGKGEKAKIEGKTQKDLEEIQSTAYRKVQTIKGTAEAEAIAIYAKALGRDPGFYQFTRNLEAYEKSLSDDSRMILSTDSKFWKILNEGRAD